MLTKPKKSLGQNFLHDKNIIDKIIKVSKMSSSDEVLEIGPGTGNLTQFIIDQNPLKNSLNRDSINAQIFNMRSKIKDPLVKVSDFEYRYKRSN